MTTPSMERVKSTLSPLEADLAQIPLDAFQGWLESSEYKYTNHSRIKTNIIWGRMVYLARKKFGDRPDIRFIEHYGTVSIVVDGLEHRVLFRLKKADKRGISKNVQTKLSNAFHDHQQRGLFGYLDPDRIEVVYILNNLGTKVQDIRVVGRNGKLLAWSYSILPQAEIVESTATSFDIEPEIATIRDKKDLVKVSHGLGE
jgi:hypothetical protein